ncbi:transglutaminase family protein [Janibacter alittae]|uniref:Transglutaminase family protein n=1 Tax=Janibacter alittae TaxID=3115209 RepID=A0ABZ2ME46_9MICO
MSTRRYRIVHHTTMRYEGEVATSHNELRMTPVDEPGQATLEARVRVRPLTWSTVYEDHWGTQVMAMEAQSPHDVLEIEAISLVERSEVAVEAPDTGWEVVRSADTQDRLSEFLAQTSRTAPPQEVAALAAQVADERTPQAAALALADRVHSALTYEPGITGWQATAADVWGTRRGVCQDFAHITLGGLRSIGIPARYVSGYVTDDPGEIPRGTSAVARNHAWVEVWDGDWHPIDPTNPGSVGLDHVVLGRGRDYDDVSPFRGMFVGPPLEELDLEITFTRVG